METKQIATENKASLKLPSNHPSSVLTQNVVLATKREWFVIQSHILVDTMLLDLTYICLFIVRSTVLGGLLCFEAGHEPYLLYRWW